MKQYSSLQAEFASMRVTIFHKEFFHPQTLDVTQGHVLAGFEYLQGWRLNNLSGQLTWVSDPPHGKRVLCLNFIPFSFMEDSIESLAKVKIICTALPLFSELVISSQKATFDQVWLLKRVLSILEGKKV